MNTVKSILSQLKTWTKEGLLSWLSFDHPFAQALLSNGELATTSFQMEFHMIEPDNSFLALYKGKLYLILDETFYSGFDTSVLHQVNLYVATDPDHVSLIGYIDDETQANLVPLIRAHLD